MKDKLLLESGVFPNESSVAYAMSVFGILTQPCSNGLLDLEKGETYTAKRFPEYLIDHCKVDPKDTKIAIELLKEENLSKLARKVERLKILRKLREFGTKSF